MFFKDFWIWKRNFTKHDGMETLETYIVRIYCRDEHDPEKIAGIVEMIGSYMSSDTIVKNSRLLKTERFR